MKPRIEFVYDNHANKTMIIVWKGMQIVDKLEMPEKLSSYQRKKIREELQFKEY